MPHEIKLNSDFCAPTPYMHGHGLVSQSIDGHQYFSQYDGFHHTRSLTDMDEVVTDTYRYDAYGTLLEQTGSTILTAIRSATATPGSRISVRQAQDKPPAMS